MDGGEQRVVDVKRNNLFINQLIIIYIDTIKTHCSQVIMTRYAINASRGVQIQCTFNNNNIVVLLMV